MSKVSLEKIRKESLWVAKIGGVRMVGTYEDVKKYTEDPDCKDFDVVCAEGQPEELQPFWKAYWDYCEETGELMSIQDFYPLWEV